MSRIANRIREIRKLRRLSQVQLAEILDTTQSQVQKLEAGDRRLTIEWLSRLSKALQCQIHDLVELPETGGRLPVSSSTFLQAAEKGKAYQPGAASSDDDIPLYGQTHPADPESVLLGKDFVIGRIPRHPKQSGWKDAFAVYCVGSQMAPRYRHGEIIYAIAGRAPSAQEDVIIELKDRRAFAAEYVKTDHNQGRVSYRLLSKSQSNSVSQNQIQALYLIVGRG